MISRENEEEEEKKTETSAFEVLQITDICMHEATLDEDVTNVLYICIIHWIHYADQNKPMIKNKYDKVKSHLKLFV